MSLFRKPVFGKKAKKGNMPRVEYLITENVSFEVKEAFRNFKASLSVSIPKKKSGEGVAIIITSACPGDGKTTLTVNLALMFASSEAKVILIDADARKGRVARYFKTKSAPGLADYLSGQATLEEVTRTAAHSENLDYITCGTRSPRPYELLESEEMKSLLKALKEKYDYVILDTPPLLVVPDAIALVPETDGVVLACRHEVSYVSDIEKTLNKLEFAKANVLGVVVNDYTERVRKGKNRKDYKYYSYSYADEAAPSLAPTMTEETDNAN